MFYRTVALLTALLIAGCSTDRLDRNGGQIVNSDAHVFQGARVIVGDGTMIENGIIVVEGATITAVGSSAAMTLPADLPTTDLSGMTVIPALIDAHVHLGYEGYTSWRGENYSRENVIDHLQHFAYYGFGAVLTTGTDPVEMIIEIEEAQRNGQVHGADVVVAAGMAPPGQGPNAQMLASAQALDRVIVRGVSTAAEGREAVREIAQMPIPFIKIWVDDRNGAQEKLRRPVYEAIIEEANRQGIEVIAHQQTVQDMKGLLDAGVAGFLHGRLGADVDDEVVAMMLANDAFLVPNIGLTERGRSRDFEDPFLTDALPPAVVERLAREFAERPAPPEEREVQLRTAFQRMLNGDVDIILGTDAGALPDHFFGYSGHRELERFVSLGMTPMQAIQSATSIPASHLGLETLGEIAAGKRADFVVLRDDPTVDIRNTRSIVDVYLRGQRIDREGLRESFRAGRLVAGEAGIAAE